MCPWSRSTSRATCTPAGTSKPALSPKQLATTKTESSFLMFLSEVELAALKVHVSLPAGLVEIELAALKVHVPPRVRSIATSDLCKQEAVLTSALLVTSTPESSA